MTFTGRIRLYLVIIALLPPVLMMGVVYFYSLEQERISYRETSAADLRRLIAQRDAFKQRLVQSLENAARTEWFARVSYEATASSKPISINPTGLDFDFVELLDHNNTVLASWHRPGLIGETLGFRNAARQSDLIVLQESVEYDINGRHAALAGRVTGAGVISLYAGWYFDTRLQPVLENLMRGHTRLVFFEDTAATTINFADMEFGTLYESRDRYESVVSGKEDVGFVLVAQFSPSDTVSVFTSFLDAISLVAIASVLAAVGIGIYISGRAKREINNLVDAFGRVAGGDLSTPVMAYEEGEFAQLADSFSEMMHKLRQSQLQLATAQKIAAWQSMARKIAHEIKNPLTPIAISADDLRRSYIEQLPDFDQTLKKSTRMIKEETNRLARILDEFAGFARMAPPRIKEVRAGELLDALESLYSERITSGKLKVTYESRRRSLKVDPDQFRQVLVNLVKNAFEAAEDVAVNVLIKDHPEGILLSVTDTGPGFSQQAMQHSFEPYVSSKRGGSGLGLVICQRIVHDHGGTIELANNPDGGAAVTVFLPQR